MSTSSAPRPSPGPSRTDDLAFAGAARLRELLVAREVSARDLVDLFVERIARIDPRLNAFRVVLGDQARAEADRAPARTDAGATAPRPGGPVAIKDEFDVAGQLNTCGCAPPDQVAAEDSEVVRRLRA